MELESEPKKLIVEYSHGMKKKLSLACALIHRPEILFLDEPFEGSRRNRFPHIKGFALATH